MEPVEVEALFETLPEDSNFVQKIREELQSQA